MYQRKKKLQMLLCISIASDLKEPTLRPIPLYLVALLLAIGLIPALPASAGAPGGILARTITGKVTTETGAPLAGVSVMVKGTNAGTATDANGNFSINVPGNNSVLVFSSVGFITKEVIVGNQTEILLSLDSDGGGQQLSDVVVVGYGTQKKVTVTGSVAQVKGQELTKAPTVNLSNTLGGRLAGVVAINYSGEPGYDGSAIRIRGINSIGNNDALIVIDGVPARGGGLDRLNAADVETISVLKDASAAIYGSRAANGVILITTKRGRSGRPQLSYTFNQGWSRPTTTPKMSNVLEYGEMRNELAVYENVPVSEWADAYKALTTTGSYTKKAGGVVKSPQGFFPQDMTKYADGSDPWLHPNTDWFKAVFKPWSPQVRHNLQVNGGSENIRYLASLGYQDQDAFYRNSATFYKQYDIRLNVDAKINDYINVELGILGRQEDRNFPTRSAGDIFWMILRGKPNEQARWPNGLPGRDIEYGNNPAVITTNETGYDRDKRDYVQTNGKLEIKIPGVEGLKLIGTAAVDRYFYNEKRWQIPWYLYQWDGVNFESDGTTPVLVKTLRSNFTDPRLNQWSSNSLTTNLTGQINYDRTIKQHTFNFLAGVQREKLYSENLWGYRRFFISSAIDQIFAGGDLEKDVSGSAFERARLSYYGRVNYNYAEKYMLEFLWRYDGSYIFPEASRFGFFPGVTAGWRISQEKFFESIKPVVNDLKLRGSWGTMGAEPYFAFGGLAEYQFLSTYSFQRMILNDQVVRALRESRIPNPDFTWEIGINRNIGLDAAFLNHRLNLELDVFSNKRNNALIQPDAAVPQTLGQSLPVVNAGELENKGFDFKLTYSGNAGDFKYSFGLTGGYNKNKIIKWADNPAWPEWQLYTGKRLGTSGVAYMYYLTDGVFKDQAEIDANKIDYSAVTGSLRPGDLKIVDYNADGKINADDQVRSNQTRDPFLTGGLTGNLQYKGFDLSFLFQGAHGGLFRWGTGSSGDIGNYIQYVYDNHWSVDKPNSEHPRIASRNNTWYTGGGAANNAYWYRSNDYIRLKNLELGYTVTLPKQLQKAISNLRVFTNAFNLFTFNKFKLWDPESSAGEGVYYPQQKIVNVGASVTF
jgi:TonB-linked SusC/RagA family outer membrane protein